MPSRSGTCCKLWHASAREESLFTCHINKKTPVGTWRGKIQTKSRLHSDKKALTRRDLAGAVRLRFSADFQRVAHNSRNPADSLLRPKQTLTKIVWSPAESSRQRGYLPTLPYYWRYGKPRSRGREAAGPAKNNSPCRKCRPARDGAVFGLLSAHAWLAVRPMPYPQGRYLPTAVGSLLKS